MSLLSESKTGAAVPIDNVFVIYGMPGSGKTTIASTFPKSKERPLLYIDVLEGGAGVIDPNIIDGIKMVQVGSFEEFDEVLTDCFQGYTIDSTGKTTPVDYSTIVVDSVTQLEYLIKQHLKKVNNKESMNIGLWGQLKDSQEYIFNTLKALNIKTNSYVVAIAHEKKVEDEANPSYNKIIPSLMASAAYSLCAKASFVWYCKVDSEDVVDPNTNAVTQRTRFITQIDVHPYLLSKTRKPKGFPIPQSIENLTFTAFKKNVIDKIREQIVCKPSSKI